jgi:sterol desaturase/sphingolipid hydroxylase (fatty acid hydroxylase superfamily)
MRAAMTAILLAVLAVMLTWEWMSPRSRWPAERWWWARLAVAVLAQVSVIYVVGRTAAPWLSRHPLVSSHPLGPIAGALVGVGALTLVDYAWHRACHATPLLWRWVHQLHHSPERVVLASTYYMHPFEMLANSVLTCVVCYGLLGLTPASASLVSFALGLTSLFAHWNVRTPRWVGFLLQRPESHCLHHAAVAQRANFSNLPLWDALFGTLANPPSRASDPVCGLGPGTEVRVLDMLKGVDVTRSAA